MRPRTGILLAAAGTAAAFVFVVSAAGAPLRATKAVGDLLPSCYPDNEYTIWYGYGAFKGSSTGSFTNANSSASWSFKAKVTDNYAKGNVPFKSTSGSLAGSMTATLTVPGIAHTIQFTASCIQEAYAGTAFAPGGELSVAFEGHVDLPPWAVGSNQAVLLIDVWSGTMAGLSASGVPPVADGVQPQSSSGTVLPDISVNGGHAWVSLRHAVTCSEPKGDTYRSTFTGDVKGSFGYTLQDKGNPDYRMRASLPSGYSAHPGKVCQGLNYGF